MRAKLSYANVMATIAVFVSLGGGAYAATTLKSNQVKARHIAKNAVGPSEIKSRAVGRSELKRGAVDSLRVADGALRPQDFAAGALPMGPAGPAGAQGPPGAPGERGPEGPANPNANTLDGIDSTGFTRSDGRRYFERRELPRGSGEVVLFDMPGLGQMRANCYTGPGIDGRAELRLYFEGTETYRGVSIQAFSGGVSAFSWDIIPTNEYVTSSPDYANHQVTGGKGSAPGPRVGFDASLMVRGSSSPSAPCLVHAHVVVHTR